MAGTRRKVRWSWHVTAILLGMFLLGGSVAVASIPQGNTINACRNAQTGALRVIDTSTGAKCATGELPAPVEPLELAAASGSVSRSTTWPTSSPTGAPPSSPGSKPPIGTPPTNTNYWSLVASKGAIGLTGLQGIPGIQGLPGVQGIQGIPGVPGVQGLQGIPGVPGVAGAVGRDGSAGHSGSCGRDGSAGHPGSGRRDGFAGHPGSRWRDGFAGSSGCDRSRVWSARRVRRGDPGSGPGATGPQGIQGLTGATGATGVVDAIFAKINSNGTLATGKHVSTASSTGGLTPTYTITFDQNVSAVRGECGPRGGGRNPGSHGTRRVVDQLDVDAAHRPADSDAVRRNGYLLARAVSSAGVFADLA